jgi:hypothetical protein
METPTVISAIANIAVEVTRNEKALLTQMHKILKKR